MSAFEMVQVACHAFSHREPSRKTCHTAGLWRALFSSAVTSLAGCGAVAGPEYTGEVGLELRGKVVSLDENQENLVPALAFFGEDAVHLVTGEVTGQFPRHFVLRIDEPPPREALRTTPQFGQAKIGVALLTMVPKGHPSRTSYETNTETDGFTITNTLESGEPDPETGLYTKVDQSCGSETEECENADVFLQQTGV